MKPTVEAVCLSNPEGPVPLPVNSYLVGLIEERENRARRTRRRWVTGDRGSEMRRGRNQIQKRRKVRN